MDLLERAKRLGIEVECSRERFEVKVYSKQGKQAHIRHYKTIEGLSGFVDGFQLSKVADEIASAEG